MTEITYTYPLGRGEQPESGLTASQVAEARLGHDGHTYELRRDDGGWALYVSRMSINADSRGGGMSLAYTGPAPYGKPLTSRAASKAAAWAELAPRVARAEWDDVPEAMTDIEYTALLAEMAAEE